MIYAVGVGPLQTDEGKYFTRLAFEQADTVTVRDAESKALLESLALMSQRYRSQPTLYSIFKIETVKARARF